METLKGFMEQPIPWPLISPAAVLAAAGIWLFVRLARKLAWKSVELAFLILCASAVSFFCGGLFFRKLKVPDVEKGLHGLERTVGEVREELQESLDQVNKGARR